MFDHVFWTAFGHLLVYATSFGGGMVMLDPDLEVKSRTGRLALVVGAVALVCVGVALFISDIWRLS